MENGCKFHLKHIQFKQGIFYKMEGNIRHLSFLDLLMSDLK